MKRRRFITVTAGLLALTGGGLGSVATSCGKPRYKETKRKLVVLAFDGLDRAVLDKFINDGLLPNFAQFINKYGITTVETTLPAETETAWTSLATGLAPDEHGAYGSVARSPDGRTLIALPVEHHKNHSWLPWGARDYETVNAVGAPAFWERTARSGIRTIALRVPFDVPPPRVPGSSYLGGPGLPDATLGHGRYYYLTTNPAEIQRDDLLFGGFTGVLDTSGNKGTGTIYGPPVEGEARAEVRFEFVISNPQVVDIYINGKPNSVRTGKVSAPVTIDFDVGRSSVKTQAAFYLISAEPEVRIYVSPLNFYPDASVYLFSEPDGFALELYERYGHYHTAGNPFDTLGVADGAAPEHVFGENLLRIIKTRRLQVVKALEDYPWNLFFHFDDSLKHVQHIFFKFREAEPRAPQVFLAYGDLLHKSYKLADRLLGEVMKRAAVLRSDVAILSAYGFAAVGKWVNLNAWLSKNGYLATMDKPMTDIRVYAPDDPRHFTRAFESVDWAKTRAYSCGPGFIYLNSAEPGNNEGIIKGKGELLKDISRTLMDLKDEGISVCSRVDRGDKVLPALGEGTRPDLVVSLKPGYRISGASELGLVGPSVIVKNDTLWSGDHATVDPNEVPGLFLSTAGGVMPSAITDVAGFINDYYGL